jgi:hypothetical protein
LQQSSSQFLMRACLTNPRRRSKPLSSVPAAHICATAAACQARWRCSLCVALAALCPGRTRTPLGTLAASPTRTRSPLGPGLGLSAASARCSCSCSRAPHAADRRCASASCGENGQGERRVRLEPAGTKYAPHVPGSQRDYRGNCAPHPQPAGMCDVRRLPGSYITEILLADFIPHACCELLGRAGQDCLQKKAARSQPATT